MRGVIGEVFLANLGEPEEVTKAIGEQYLPNYENGNLPATDIGFILAVSGKIDELCSNILSRQESYSRQVIIENSYSALARYIKEKGFSFDTIIDLVSYDLELLFVEPKEAQEIAGEISKNLKERSE